MWDHEASACEQGIERPRRTSTPTLIGLLFVASCSGGTSIGGEMTGGVHGQSVKIVDAISASITQARDDGTTRQYGVVVMADKSHLCEDMTSWAFQPNETLVLFTLSDLDGTTFHTPTKPGVYTVETHSQATNTAGLEIVTFDDHCKAVNDQEASGASGTITLTAIDGDAFSGQFDVMLDSDDHITGTFEPRECPALVTLFNTQGPTGEPACH